MIGRIRKYLKENTSFYRHLAYGKYVIRHKKFVWIAGRKIGVSRRHLFFHDWSKFLPSEWVPYAQTFYESDGTKMYEPDWYFPDAWNHHQKLQKHHWQYHVLIWDKPAKDRPQIQAIDIKDFRHMDEMIADWMGAGMANGFSDTKAWYEDNKDYIMLEESCRIYIESIMEIYKWTDEEIEKYIPKKEDK